MIAWSGAHAVDNETLHPPFVSALGTVAAAIFGGAIMLKRPLDNPKIEDYTDALVRGLSRLQKKKYKRTPRWPWRKQIYH